MYIQERSIALYILLTIVNCGLFAFYWIYCINEDVKHVSQDGTMMDGGLVILLTIVTCGLFGIYWAYVIAKKQDELQQQWFGTAPDQTMCIVTIILWVFGLSIIDLAIFQDTNNKFARTGAMPRGYY